MSRQIRRTSSYELQEWHNCREQLFEIFDDVINIIDNIVLRNLVYWDQLRDAEEVSKKIMEPLRRADFDEAWIGLSEFLEDSEMDYYFGRGSDSAEQGLRTLSQFAVEFEITKYEKPLGR